MNKTAVLAAALLLSGCASDARWFQYEPGYAPMGRGKLARMQRAARPLVEQETSFGYDKAKAVAWSQDKLCPPSKPKRTLLDVLRESRQTN